MKCEKKGEKNDFVIPLTTRFTLGWVSCFLGNTAVSEMRGGICLILHADLCFVIRLEIVMLGFQAVALRHWTSSTSDENILPWYVCIGKGQITIFMWDYFSAQKADHVNYYYTHAIDIWCKVYSSKK